MKTACLKNMDFKMLRRLDNCKAGNRWKFQPGYGNSHRKYRFLGKAGRNIIYSSRAYSENNCGHSKEFDD